VGLASSIAAIQELPLHTDAERSVNHSNADKVSGKHNTCRVLAPTDTAFGPAFPAGHRSPGQAKAEPAGEGALEVAVDVGGVADLGVDVGPRADRSRQAGAELHRCHRLVGGDGRLLKAIVSWPPKSRHRFTSANGLMTILSRTRLPVRRSPKRLMKALFSTVETCA